MYIFVDVTQPTFLYFQSQRFDEYRAPLKTHDFRADDSRNRARV